MTDPERCVDYENVSKKTNGSFKQIHFTKKVVPAYTCPEEGGKCPIFILYKYIGKLPPLENLFYVRPLQNTVRIITIWLRSGLIGHWTE